jgi:spermidine synthase
MALYIPLYGSLWCLGVASDSANPRAVATETIAQRLAERQIGALKYYNAPLHSALFTLPNFVLELTGSELPAAPQRMKAVA